MHSNTEPNAKPICAHYSFDYAQQVHYPSDPMQPGPIFFLTPRKCSIFGVCCEALPRQVNFLTDEASECGKGANIVISQLHYFFTHHGLGEKEVYLHCDNCTGQNKNSAMLHYLLWRCMTGLHTKITLSFLVVGHTKFSPDWCFGLVKCLYRRTKIGSLKDIAQVVSGSAECNFPQLVADENGLVIVPRLDWTSFFAPRMKKCIGIKKYHHFHFDSEQPGVIGVQLQSDNPTKWIKLLKEEWSPHRDDVPDTISPKGLSVERQWYLHDSIRPFCPENDKDITCPLPSVERPGSRRTTPVSTFSPSPMCESPPTHLPPPISASSPKKRRCGKCKQIGHNSRTCNQ